MAEYLIRIHAGNFIAIMLSAVLCSTSPTVVHAKDKLAYDADRPLTTLHGATDEPVNRKQYGIDRLDGVLQALLIDDAHGKPYPFVLYVHGRGNEPAKSFQDTGFGFVKGHVLEKIESDDVRVLGINWDSKKREDCERPISRAEAAAPLFNDVVARLISHRKTHRELWRDRPTVLLVHSMGSFVLRQAMQMKGAVDNVREMFDVRVITGSDAPALNHSTWLAAGGPGKTYVVTNPNDRVLRKSMKCQKKSKEEPEPRLGQLDVDNTSGYAADASYVQLAVGKKHRTFTRGGADGNENACAVMLSLMRGVEPSMDATWRRSGAGDRWYVPRPAHASAACTKGADDDDRD